LSQSGNWRFFVFNEEEPSKLAKFVRQDEILYSEDDETNLAYPSIMGSFSSYGTMHFLKETQEKALMAAQTIWKEVYGDREFKTVETFSAAHWVQRGLCKAHE